MSVRVIVSVLIKVATTTVVAATAATTEPASALMPPPTADVTDAVADAVAEETDDEISVAVLPVLPVTDDDADDLEADC
jgi:hypothetical protein